MYGWRGDAEMVKGVDSGDISLRRLASVLLNGKQPLMPITGA